MSLVETSYILAGKIMQESYSWNNKHVACVKTCIYDVTRMYQNNYQNRKRNTGGLLFHPQHRFLQAETVRFQSSFSQTTQRGS